MMTLTFMAISSMMLAGCSAALFVSPPRRPPLLARLPKRPCLRATLATLLAGMLRPRALDRSEEMVLVIAAWIWLLRREMRRIPTSLQKMDKLGFGQISIFKSCTCL